MASRDPSCSLQSDFWNATNFLSADRFIRKHVFDKTRVYTGPCAWTRDQLGHEIIMLKYKTNIALTWESSETRLSKSRTTAWGSVNLIQEDIKMQRSWHDNAIDLISIHVDMQCDGAAVRLRLTLWLIQNTALTTSALRSSLFLALLAYFSYSTFLLARL